MRKALLAIPVLAIALLLQLTVLNRLQLPGGGVPDLVLVLVAAVALAAGPVPGMVFGFVAGLGVDLAPPGSPVIGQYALAFCLAGWLCGRLQATASRSALRTVVWLAVVIAGTECFIAVLARALGQVTVTQARHVLPSTILYDLLISPFVVYLVLVVSSWLDDGLIAGQPASGLLPGPNRLLARRARRKAQPPQPHQPQLRRAAARSGDRWLVTTPRALPGLHPNQSAARRLRPGAGVAGSASGYAHSGPGLPAVPVQLRLAERGRRGDGAIGSAPGGPHLAGRHPGMLSGARGPGSRAFRPHGGLPGGSAAATYSISPVPLARPSVPKFRNYRSDTGLARSFDGTVSGMRRPAAVPKLRFSGSRSAAVSPVRSPAVPKLRFSGSRTAAAPAMRPASVPKLDFRTRQRGTSRHRPAEPKFRAHQGASRQTALSAAAISSGGLDQQAFRAMRRNVASPRLRLASNRNSSGMLGGTGRSPAAPSHGPHQAVPHFRTHRKSRRVVGAGRKSPKFGYGRRSLLSFLAAKHVGGRWLASRRAGTRSGVWVISKRPGGSA